MKRSLAAACALLLLPLIPVTAQADETVSVAAVVESGGELQVRRWDVPLAVSTAFTRQLDSSGFVLAAGVVGRRHTMVGTPTSDPRRNEQWGLSRLDVSKLRELGSGKGITVAVVDTGVSADHPDLVGQVLPGIDLVDDGGDGRKDPNGHGTHVAGVIAASVNGTGVEGIAPGVRILPVRVLGENGYGDDAEVAFGILWAVRNGAQVINLSLGGDQLDPLLQDAVDKAAQAGVVVVAAAGNSGATSPTMYPAAHPSVLAVGATGADDDVTVFSSHGPYVDVAAPGSMILSTWPNGYQFQSGTSMAAPFVAGAAAILLERGLSPAEVDSRLRSSAYDLGPKGVDTGTGSGIIDVVAAAAGTLPRADQPSSLPPSTLPSLPKPSLPQLPFPTLPGVPDFRTNPALPVLPSLPSPPTGSNPDRSVPVPDASMPARRTFTKLESDLTAEVSRRPRALVVTAELKASSAVRSTALAFRELHVVATLSGSRTKRLVVRTGAGGKVTFTVPLATRRLSLSWAGDAVTSSAHTTRPV